MLGFHLTILGAQCPRGSFACSFGAVGDEFQRFFVESMKVFSHGSDRF